MMYPVIVVGMHRSGTSLVSRLLHQLGVFMGADQQRDAESRFFLALNKYLFDETEGANWDLPAPVASMLEDSGKAAAWAKRFLASLRGPGYKGFLGDHITAKTAGGMVIPAGAWGFKDPRNSYLLPVWLNVFPEARVLHVRRNGLDVAASLAKRHGELVQRYIQHHGHPPPKEGFFSSGTFKFTHRVADLDGALGLWSEYMGHIEQTLQGVQTPVHECRYEDVVADPTGEFGRLIDFCGIHPDENLRQQAIAGIKPEGSRRYLEQPELIDLARRHVQDRWFGYEADIAALLGGEAPSAAALDDRGRAPTPPPIPVAARSNAPVDTLQNEAPVAIGGVGGSGTRLIAQILRELGFDIGGDLNEPLDNLWFTLLFKRADILATSEAEFDTLTQLFVDRMRGLPEANGADRTLLADLAADDRPQHSSAWLQRRVLTFLKAPRHETPPTRWGWKEPNTHIVLDRLRQRLPRMKYIHVMRNGLDMAFSRNQNQLEIWGRPFAGVKGNRTARDSLHYWCASHRRVLEIGKTMGEDFLLLNYDQFCRDPDRRLPVLLEFLGVTASPEVTSRLVDLVKLPDSIGRHTQHNLNIFDPADVDYVRALGFDIAPTPAPTAETQAVRTGVAPPQPAPLVTVVIPVYNAAAYLDEALGSIREQTHAQLEILVVDDGSTDESRDIIRRHQQNDRRIGSLRLATNGGVSKARNLAIRQARGDYIALMDADDDALPERIRASLDFLQARPQLGGVFTKIACIDDAGRALASTSQERLFNAQHQRPIRRLMLERSRFCAPTALLRKDALFQAGLFNTRLSSGEDYALWNRLLDHWPLARLDEVLLHYRIHDRNLSFQADDRRLERMFVSASIGAAALGRWPLETLAHFKATMNSPQRLEEERRHIRDITETLLDRDQKIFGRPYVYAAAVWNWLIAMLASNRDPDLPDLVQELTPHFLPR